MSYDQLRLFIVATIKPKSNGKFQIAAVLLFYIPKKYNESCISFQGMLQGCTNPGRQNFVLWRVILFVGPQYGS